MQLQNNNIQELPSELWRLTSLEELNLGHNQLKSIPKKISLLVNLKELYLHSNQIDEIPSDIGKLPHLVVLDLTDNQLTCLPAELLKLEFWQFWIEGNPFSRENVYPTILSLKSICSQIVGTLSSLEEESRTIVEENLPLTIQQEMFQDAQCTSCDGLLFHSDSFVLHNRYLFKACSQTCLFAIKKEIKD